MFIDSKNKKLRKNLSLVSNQFRLKIVSVRYGCMSPIKKQDMDICLPDKFS